MEERCGKCTECVDICPPHAFTGEPYRTGEPRDVRFAAHKCEVYFGEIRREAGHDVCGLCLYVCPIGRRAKRAS
jgi:epoxyqueuosine reductase QueG